jgi:hypothetical protein
MQNKKNNERGFIQLIILIIVFLVVLTYYGFDVKAFQTNSHNEH